MVRISNLISTVFGIGYLPKAPGTWCSFIAVLIWYFFLAGISTHFFILIITIIFFAGVYFSGQMTKTSENKDPAEIVIDEWTGQWLAFVFLDHSIVIALACFVIFRALDIIKPFPISYFESLPGGWGVMLDDVAAGILTSLIVNLYYVLI